MKPGLRRSLDRVLSNGASAAIIVAVFFVLVFFGAFFFLWAPAYFLKWFI